MENKQYLTVKELSDELNVSVQTVYKYIKEIDHKHTKKIKNKLHITAAGVEEVKELYLKNNQSESSDTAANNDITKKYIETLERELEIKNEQIKNKDKLLDNLAERLRENNIMLYNQSALTSPINETEGQQQGRYTVNTPKKATIKERLRFLFKGM